MSLLIKNVAIADVLEDEIKTGDIYIKNGRFEKIAEHIDASEIEELPEVLAISRAKPTFPQSLPHRL